MLAWPCGSRIVPTAAVFWLKLSQLQGTTMEPLGEHPRCTNCHYARIAPRVAKRSLKLDTQSDNCANARCLAPRVSSHSKHAAISCHKYAPSGSTKRPGDYSWRQDNIDSQNVRDLPYVGSVWFPAYRMNNWIYSLGAIGAPQLLPGIGSIVRTYAAHFFKTFTQLVRVQVAQLTDFTSLELRFDETDWLSWPDLTWLDVTYLTLLDITWHYMTLPTDRPTDYRRAIPIVLETWNYNVRSFPDVWAHCSAT